MITGTFSIAAHCPVEQSLGAAVATAIPAAGAICPFVTRHGAILTQAFNNYYFGIDGTSLLGEGLTSALVGETLVRQDPGRERRQLLIVDARGTAWAFTGSECVTERGHCVGDGYAVAGNMLANREVLSAMVASFELSARSGMPLAERLMCVLEAGQAAGGDKRGKQSAALKVIGSSSMVPLCDLRVDDHHEPVAELRRVLEVAKRVLLPYMAEMPDRQRADSTLPSHLSELLRKAPSDR